MVFDEKKNPQNHYIVGQLSSTDFNGIKWDQKLKNFNLKLIPIRKLCFSISTDAITSCSNIRHFARTKSFLCNVRFSAAHANTNRLFNSIHAFVVSQIYFNMVIIENIFVSVLISRTPKYCNSQNLDIDRCSKLCSIFSNWIYDIV